MYNPFPTEDSELDNAITRAYDDLMSMNAGEDTFSKAVANLSKLYAIQNAQRQHHVDSEKADLEINLKDEAQAFEQAQASRPFWERVDPNTVLTVATNVLIGLAVIKYEQTGVISTKVMSFMRKI